MTPADHSIDTRTEMRWNGWGDPAKASDLPFAVRRALPLLLGRVRRPDSPIEPSNVVVPQTRLTETDVALLAAAVGVRHVDCSDLTRVRHAGGRSTPDLLQRRQHDQDAPDAVVRPATHDEVAACLRVAQQQSLAVIPFGGGTSVVGALAPERGVHRAVISLDLRRLNGLLQFDRVSLEATFGAGTTGPDAESALAMHGAELGHFPQSFEYATLGGFAAARSSGQNSAGHGRFDSMVTGLRVVTPTGELDLGRSPGSAAGPDLLRVFLGSEGTLGVITEVRVRVHPAPERRICEAWSFADFDAGMEGLRRVSQSVGGPTVIRLSDEAETAVSLAQVGKIGQMLARGASAITVYEGADLEHRREQTAAMLTEAGGKSSGEAPAEAWLRGRFEGPYLRDALLDAGVFCETLETASTWSRLPALREAVTSALAGGFSDAGARSYIMCHISHVYPTGASLYFTVLGNLRGDVLTAWNAIKRGVCDAIVAAGGTISHHHGVGRDHAPWLTDEIGQAGVRVLAAIKHELDPRSILNPGALVPAPDADA